jgi:hypothetical protein
MNETLEQYFPSNVLNITDTQTSLENLSIVLAMAGRSSNKAEQNNEWLDIRTIGCFVFYVINFDSMPEGGRLPFSPQKPVCGVYKGGTFMINTDGTFSGDGDETLCGMGYAFSFEDRR